MTVNTVDTSTPLVGLKAGAEVYNANFTDSNNAASKEVGTLPDNVPTNADLGSSSLLDTGTAAGEVPTNAILAPYLGRNLLINADFSINQRAVSGTVVLAAGEYGHDRFKAGAGGCTYTFATSTGVTTKTITAGTLLQVVEGATIPSSDIILSWTGTAQGRIDSGSYGNSGLVTDTTTGGSNVTVEFNSGTLAHPQLDRGAAVTDFKYVNPADQLARCQRYFERLSGGELGEEFNMTSGPAANTTDVWFTVPYTTKRSQPVITASGVASALRAGSSIDGTISVFSDITTKSARGTFTRDSSTHTSTDFFLIRLSPTTSDYIDIDAEL